jgi:uncharacterized protein (DUF934 family)
MMAAIANPVAIETISLLDVCNVSFPLFSDGRVAV